MSALLLIGRGHDAPGNDIVNAFRAVITMVVNSKNRVISSSRKKSTVYSNTTASIYCKQLTSDTVTDLLGALDPVLLLFL